MTMPPAALPSYITCLSLLALTLSTLGLVGCHASQDRQQIHSTRQHPANVTIVDTVHDRVLWRMQVPVDHQLELDFQRPGADRARVRLGEGPATEVAWGVEPIDGGPIDADLVPEGLINSGQLKLPGNPVRVQVEHRDQLRASAHDFFRYDQAD